MLTITSPDALTAAEVQLLIRLGEAQHYAGEMQVRRHTPVEFDLRVFGARGYAYSNDGKVLTAMVRAWLPLACLRMWYDDIEVATRFFDAQELTDWSFVRDQSPDVHWHNFEFIRSRVPG